MDDRCWLYKAGNHADGSVRHYVPAGSWTALCGSRPGRRSNWSDDLDPPMRRCVRCLGRMEATARVGGQS